MFAIFCACCEGLLGYFGGQPSDDSVVRTASDALALAVKRWGGCCPQCSNTRHPNKVEERYQQEAHLRWSAIKDADFPDGTCYIVVPSAGDAPNAPGVVHLKRLEYLEWLKGDRLQNHPTERVAQPAPGGP